ncbi:c-type cytochrome [Oceanibaculum indicum]|uniref:Mono/diheme cytochrome c family protein n=1 Tax=Oceanibaculum indicum TaxID=526216 RepID=A0A420WHC3_9PROT|nr:cytochrome c [Oceanibaculum indicum]RKQ70325.1 mono/diheme cytochrome c family protein [Oceanibaculum indicum]
MAIDPYKRRQQRLDAKRGVKRVDEDAEEGMPGLPRISRSGKFLLTASIIAAIATIGAVFWDRESVKRADTADPDNAAQVQLGRAVYFGHCAYCHGDALEGKPGWQQTFPQGGRPPTPLDADGPSPLRSDKALFEIVKYGGQPYSPRVYRNDMPGYEHRLDDAEIWAVIAYVQKQWPDAVREERRDLNR